MSNPIPGPARQYVTPPEPIAEAVRVDGALVEQLSWWPVPGANLPDMEMTVLCQLANGEVWQGWLDTDGWRAADSGDLFSTPVVRWSEPQGPAL